MNTQAGSFRRIVVLLLLVLGTQAWLLLGHGLWNRNWHLPVLAVIVVIGLIPRVNLRVAALLDAMRNPSPRTVWITGAIISVLSAIYMYITAVHQKRQFALHIQDEFSYMIQMRMLLRGRLWMPAHPVGEFFENFYLLHLPKYASIYFPGTALMLWPGLLFGWPAWVWPVCVGGAVVGMVYRVTAELIDSVCGLLAALLILGMPLFRFMSLRVMSTVPAIMLVLLVIWAWLRWRRAESSRTRAMWAIATGAFGGWLAITRPLDAMCLGILLFTVAIARCRALGWPTVGRTFACCSLGAAPFFAMQLVMNKGITGRWLTTPYQYYHERDAPGAGFGFGKFDSSVEPQSTLPQKRAFYHGLVARHLQRHQASNVLRDWWRERIPMTLERLVPNPLLYFVLPCAVLGLNSGRRWAMFGMLGAPLLVYELFTFFLPTYAMIAAPAMAFAGALAVHVLSTTWQNPWARSAAVVISTLFVAALPIISAPEFDRLQSDDLLLSTVSVNAIDETLANLPQKPAIVLFRYSPNRSADLEPVYNPDVAWPDDARVIRAHSFGQMHNFPLYEYYARHGPDRAVYLFDEEDSSIEPLGMVRDLGIGKMIASAYNPTATRRHMADNQRIEQFRKMANDDPNNEIGHFSLGRSLLEAGEFSEAAQSFQRVIALNPNISKAYQMLGQAQLQQGQRDLAIESLKTGARTAHNRGDLMPKNEMIKMLAELGVEMPDLASKPAAQPVGEGQIQCHRCGQVKPKMAHPPFSNAQGKLIHEKICADCWREWIGMGTKVINELRLPLSDPQAQKIFDQHMMEFLNLA